jgi:hypothetical protein
MTQAVALAQLGNSSVNFRNKIINGNFDIWQRGTSFTTAGYSADRWLTSADTNSGWTVSRQAFSFGQTEVPGEPTYFMRFAISANNLAGPVIQQRIEDVRTFAGKTVTASFYAKVSAGSTFTPGYFRMTQNFGSSGSADAFVVANETVTPLTSSWVKYTYTFNVPSISGKTIGAGNYVTFMFRIPDSTTTTVDFAQVQVEEGNTATAFEQRPIGVELQLCQRYLPGFNSTGTVPLGAGYTYSTSNSICCINFPVQTRIPPTGISISAAGHFQIVASQAYTATDVTFNSASSLCGFIQMTSSGLTVNGGSGGRFASGSGQLLFTGCEL